MATFDYAAMQSIANSLLTEFGMSAVLRRASADPTDRPCIVAITDYMPKDRANELANPTDRRVYISAVSLEVPPDNELDVLVPLIGPDANVTLPFTSPVKIFAPAGIVVLYECTVRR
jgi:hypothetical protein